MTIALLITTVIIRPTGVLIATRVLVDAMRKIVRRVVMVDNATMMMMMMTLHAMEKIVKTDITHNLSILPRLLRLRFRMTCAGIALEIIVLVSRVIT